MTKRLTALELLDELRRLLTPTTPEHDEHPASYWANRALDTDLAGNRIPTLSDCDWPKEHLRRYIEAMQEIEKLSSIHPMDITRWSKMRDIINKMAPP